MIAYYKYSVKNKLTLWDSFQQWLKEFPDKSYPFQVKHLYLTFNNLNYSSYYGNLFSVPETPMVLMEVILEFPPDRWSVLFRGSPDPIDVPYPWRYLTIRIKDPFSKVSSSAAVVSDKMSLTPTDELFHEFLGNIVPNHNKGWVCPGKAPYPQKSSSFEELIFNALNAHFFGVYNSELYSCVVSAESETFRSLLGCEANQFAASFKDVKKSFSLLSKHDQSFWKDNRESLFFRNVPVFPGFDNGELVFNDNCSYPLFDEDRRQLFSIPVTCEDLYTLEKRDRISSLLNFVTEVSPHFMLVNSGYGYWN